MGSARKGGPGLPTRVGAWLAAHRRQLAESLGRLARYPVGSAMTIGAIATALALPAGLDVLVKNARALAGGWESAVDFSVYLEPAAPLERAAALAEEVGAMPNVRAVELVTADDALIEFRAFSGLADAIDALAENPLPHALVVRPVRELAADDAARLAETLAALPDVDDVQLDTAWVERFQSLLELARRLVTIAAALLAVGVVILIGNTIRLDIQNRRDEIEVTKLIGASDGFIRRPFLYGGFWYGLAGGLLAVVLTVLTTALLTAPVERLAGLYGSDFRLLGVSAGGAIAIVAAGTALGWIGSFIATARHLRAIEPS